MPRIIIGVDDRERSEDAIKFGGTLARAWEADVTLVHAYPWDFVGYPEARAYDDFLREDAEATLRRWAEPLRDLARVEMRAVPDRSPARALQKVAEEQHAGLMVVGSSHTGRLGRVLPGSTGERLLHGSPCPVAVVPAGHGTARPSAPQVIACGWDGSPEAEAALGAAEELARATSASLRVVRASEPVFYSYPPGLGVAYAELLTDRQTRAEQSLRERVAHLSSGVSAEAELHDGVAADVLVGVSETVDIMVLGSRGYGPLRAVLLGGVSGKVLRSAACPVVVVPNGAHAALGSLFATHAQAAE